MSAALMTIQRPLYWKAAVQSADDERQRRVGLSRVLSLSVSDVGLQRSDCYRIEMTVSPVSSSSSSTLEPVGGIASAFATETIAMDPS
ncbi:hypothetical protein Y043_5093 [Burkholderia pseudomallei MSHR2138]|nr:hypothetical protein Y043_5093 [Burkholderia pseudomallei MSHR2138]